MNRIIFTLLFSFLCLHECNSQELPQMYFSDSTYGKTFAKDPDVVKFKDRYFMYYSMKMPKGYAVGIATSQDLVKWKKEGELLPGYPEDNGS